MPAASLSKLNRSVNEFILPESQEQIQLPGAKSAEKRKDEL